MKEHENKSELKTSLVNEPIAAYESTSKKRMAVFTSFDQAAEADYEFYRNLTPEQRMNIHYQLSLSFFGESKTTLKGRFSF